MLEIKKYGVTLKLLDQEDLELVRTWRNDPRINQHLITRDFISPEQQKRWFSQLDLSCHQYFVIHSNDKKVGLVYVTKIDHTKKTGTPGIFIDPDARRDPLLAFRSIFALLDYCFDNLGLEKLFAEVLKTNQKAIELNRAFGYEFVPGAGTEEYDLYVLTKATCQKKTEPFKRLLK
jgi:UDP-4-amino-4,6-dideoxy-N-acetyl-beta-L-altrosamine N-acetyltransferase